MSLSLAQLATLKTAIVADGTLNALPNTPDNNQIIADAFNATASPDYYVWRTNVSEDEYTGLPGVDVANGGAATNWSWTAYIARSVQEQNTWERMFATGSVNPSRVNVRQAIPDLFSGSTNNAPAQRTHLTVVSKRKATRAEKLFSTTAAPNGNGAFATPAGLTFEGLISYPDVEAARNN